MDKTLYEKDYHLWLQETAQLLQDGRLLEIDIENLLEEIQSMSRSEQKALKSNLRILLLHLLKWQYQPEKRSGSGCSSIIEHRNRIRDSFEDSPSLKSCYNNFFAQSYQSARELAAAETELNIETFPIEALFNSEKVLESAYFPD